MFHPAPEPVASAMSSGCEAVTVLSCPFSVVAGKVTVPGVLAKPSDPAVNVSEALESEVASLRADIEELRDLLTAPAGH